MPLPPVLRSRVLIRSALGLLSILLLLALLASLLLPGWLRERGAALASERLGRPVSIGSVSVQPWRLGLVLRELRVAGPDAAAPPLFELKQLDAALSWRSLWHARPVVAAVELDSPVLRLARTAPGHYDVDDILARLAQPTAEPAPSEPLQWAVYNIRLHDGRFSFDDRPVQRRHELAELRIELPFVSTLASDLQIEVQPQLSGKLDGVAFRSEAEVLPFAAQRSGRLQFKLDGLDLAPLAAYVPANAPVKPVAGRIDLDLKLDFVQPAGQAPQLKLGGEVGWREADLRSVDGEPLLSWRQLRVPLQSVEPLQRRVQLGTVRWEAPELSLHRDRQGRLNLPAAEPTPANPAPAVTPWQFGWAGFQLAEGRLRWDDQAVAAKPVQIEGLQLSTTALAWPLRRASHVEGGLQLDAAQLHWQGEFGPELADLQAELSGLGLEALRPYLPLPAGTQLAARVDARLALKIDKPLEPEPLQRARLSGQQLQIANLRLQLPGEREAAVAANAIRLDQAEATLAPSSAVLGRLALQGLQLRLQRDAEGRLNLERLVPPPNAAGAATPPWQLKLASLSLEQSGLRWLDANGARFAVEPLSLQAQGLAWPAQGTLPAQVQFDLAGLDEAGRPFKGAARGHLAWQGRVGLAPLSAQGRLVAERLPLQLFDAYLDPAWHLHLARAELGLKSEFSLQQQGADWQLSAGGDAQLAALQLQQAHEADGNAQVGDELLSWSSLKLAGLQIELRPGAPLRLGATEARLDDAFARLLVDEQGRFNLREVGRAEAAAAPPVAAASAPAPQISLGRTVIQHAAVDFTDHFIRPHYSAQLSELNGSLGAFASGNPAMAPLTLRGKVAGTGLLEIDGQLNPSGAPLAMDLRANASDIELAPLSPYAAKYAGYAIERGKLSTRMNYRIEPGGQLQAGNQIILNQLTFGDKVESPDATTLPVRLAVALLKDRNGVIDVNLPVSGSINDPEFSVGGIVWKLILNLVGKALTAPFSLFGGGGGPEASSVAFAPGQAQPSSGEVVERLARLLVERPGVQLTLTAQVDRQAEGPALRELRLGAALLAERRREDAAASQVAEADRERLLRRVYQAARLPNKPKNLLGFAKDIPAAQMRELLLASYAVDDDALRQLALQRGIALRDALIERGVPNARIFLAAPKLCEQACPPAAELALGAP